jgi:anti-sigma B factor antagonist
VQIHEHVVGDITIVDITGNLVAQSGDVALKDKVRSLIQQGRKRIVIDLGNVPYMDSSGLGELVHVYATTKNAGGTLKLLRVTKRLKDLLTITKLLTVFDAYDDEASAVASFPPA